MTGIVAGPHSPGAIRKAQRIAGVSAGGVLLPGGVSSVDSGPFDVGVGFGESYIDTVYSNRIVLMMPTPLEVPVIVNRAKPGDPPDYHEVWLPADSVLIPLLAELREETPGSAPTTIVGTALLEGGGTDKYHRLGREDPESGERAMTVRIGFCPVRPSFGYTLVKEDELFRHTRYNEVNIGLSAGPGFFILPTLTSDWFAHEGAIQHVLDIATWVGARPGDSLIVGEGNYAPVAPGGLWQQTDAWRKLCAAQPPWAGVTEAEEAEYLEIWRRQRNAFALNRTLEEEWIVAVEELAIWEATPEPKPETGLVGKEILYWQGQKANKQDASEALRAEMALRPEDCQRKAREEVGPFMNGVEKWAYRIGTQKPPGGLPDLTTTPGWFFVELQAPAKHFWINGEPVVSGRRFSPWPVKHGSGQGLNARDPTDPTKTVPLLFVESGLELQRGASGATGVTQAGVAASGAVYS